MKLTNLIALPIALVADAATFGAAGVTERIFRDERDSKEIEAVKALAEVMREANRGAK